MGEFRHHIPQIDTQKPKIICGQKLFLIMFGTQSMKLALLIIWYFFFSITQNEWTIVKSVSFFLTSKFNLVLTSKFLILMETWLIIPVIWQVQLISDPEDYIIFN